jgi:NADH-quinone oxidoreductase subunit L
MSTIELLLIPGLPLLAFAVNILFGRRYIKEGAHYVAAPAVIISWLLALKALKTVMGGHVMDVDIYTWIATGTSVARGFQVSVGFLVDQLTSVMLIVVTSVSSLVHIYSIGYMHGEKGYYRFFAFLSLFTFSMLMLVMSNNFLQLFFGWEAVGLCSYFLIGFYFEKKSAADAGKKAFIVNRFGDFGFSIGVIMIFLIFGSLHYAEVFSNVDILKDMGIDVLGFHFQMPTLIAVLLFCGAAGKSAQIPLHVWLPDAMEGPTPVSALIHAATMVTAGVFMVARCSPIFNLSPNAMALVAIVGALTAFFAGTVALVQRDIKRIIAYSAVSQLGYMFIACGVGAYTAAIFHLYTHAFFKALLFLGAGSVMHAMHGELDIYKMGGLKKHMPHTYWTFLLASLSIAGVPLFAGFFSKDEILWLAFNGGVVGKFVWFIGAITALMTAFYSFRIIYVAFHGEFRGTKEQEHHLHESPKSMTIPLWILAVGAIGAGYVGLPAVLGENVNLFAHYMEPVLGHPEVHASHAAEWGFILMSIAIAGAGIWLAWYVYSKKPGTAERIAKDQQGLYQLFWNKYYIDELYRATIIRPTVWVADKVIVGVTDGRMIEAVVNGVPRFIYTVGGVVRRVQNGLTHRYAGFMGFGFLLLVGIMFVWY